MFARGLLRHQWTRDLLSTSSADDDVLAGLDAAQRATLTPRREGDGLRFDIHMQGDDATVFFAH